MKFSSKISTLAFVAALALSVVSCGNSDNKGGNKPALPKQDNESMTIRYIDTDSLLKQYNLAKDFDEASTNMQNKYDAAQKAQRQKVQALQAKFAEKEKNNVYATNPQQAQADQATLQKAANDAQNELAKLQESLAKEAEANQKQLTDSITNFLKDYAKQKGYDMIINKAAGFYMDEKYDVTDDVVKGLNERYTKVAKKK